MQPTPVAPASVDLLTILQRSKEQNLRIQAAIDERQRALDAGGAAIAERRARVDATEKEVVAIVAKMADSKCKCDEAVEVAAGLESEAEALAIEVEREEQRLAAALSSLRAAAGSSDPDPPPDSTDLAARRAAFRRRCREGQRDVARLSSSITLLEQEM